MRKDPDVFILRFEKWAGRGRVIGRKPWSWEGRPEHRGLTISTALEHEELKKKNTEDAIALKDVEDSFNTLQSLIHSDDAKYKLHSSGPHLSLTSFHDSQSEFTDLDAVSFKELFQFDSETKKSSVKTPKPLSSRITDPNSTKIKSIELQNSEMESSMKPTPKAKKGYSKVNKPIIIRYEITIIHVVSSD